MTDDELVRLAQAGDGSAFEQLVVRHQAAVFRAALAALRSPADAEEATQDALVRAWQKLGTFRGESAFGTWLHRVAVNVILQKRAALKTERDRFVSDENALDDVPGRAKADQADVDVERAIERLPQGARTVFVLHDVEGFTHEEIGAFLGVTAGTSKAQLHRARMILRGYLTR